MSSSSSSSSSFYLGWLARFPLVTLPSIEPPQKSSVHLPTLYVATPESSATPLSSDVECLKWQSYLALRGVKGVQLSSDIDPAGALDSQLPNLHLPTSQTPTNDESEDQLLPAHAIAEWVESQVENTSEFEGYLDEAARDESRAWITLLEGHVHAALLLRQPKTSIWHSLLFPENTNPLQSLLVPPPAFLTGIGSLVPPFGVRVPVAEIDNQYRIAIASLSDRLGSDNWFLGSQNPTALDALAFAYLHRLLSSDDSLRLQVAKRSNLVAWEQKVRSLVQAAYRSS